MDQLRIGYLKPMNPTTVFACICLGVLSGAMGLLLPGEARAQIEGTYQVVIKKQEEKKRSRWSLADWLALKQKNQLMDLWLAKNSHSSPYEFFLDVRSTSYSRLASVDGQPTGGAIDSESSHKNYGATLAAYAGIAGLRAHYAGDSENRSVWAGSFNLRLFGRALQDTHINLAYGLRGMTLNTGQAGETFQNQFGSVSLNLYLTKYFGLEGSYQRILPAQSDLDRSVEGEEASAGAFIDFGFVRVFGEWNQEFLRYDGGGQADASEVRHGFGGGLRLFF